jgi:predicted DNA-binding transcriptional regulator AlpA
MNHSPVIGPAIGLQPLLTAAQAAPLLGLALQTIYNRVSNGGDLPPVLRVGDRRLGRRPRLRFDPGDIASWRAAKRQGIVVPHDAERARRPGRPTKAQSIARRQAAERGGR